MADWIFDLYRVLRFATRLPLPVLEQEEAEPLVPASRFAVSFALCGTLIGLAGGMVVLLADALGASASLGAVLAIAAMVMLTGALHEDGLADCADGIGGGRTRERKLAIMRDPHIGSYGVLALVLSVAGRMAALAALLALSPWLALAALVAMQGVSRGFAMLLASQLDPARPDGAGAGLGQPSMGSALLGLGLSALPGAACLLIVAGPWQGLLLLALVLSGGFLVTLLVARAARQQLGGQTGDVLGASQQIVDLAGIAILSMCAGGLL
jgi:adenosylcobinamide-GDP ribazoletransferase